MKTIRNLSRRSFIKSTAIAAVAPFILPSRIQSAEVKPNDRITLGFIGMGTQNRGLLSGFLTYPQNQVLAVCDVDITRRENAKKMVEDYYAAKNANGSYKGCATYHDFRELIGRKDIDAVVIATPDHWHAFIAITAANAKKDIYCEKPLCQSIHESQSLVTAVRNNNVVFQTGSMQRSSREFRTACELVRNGIIGKIKTVEVSVGGPPVPCNLPTELDEPGLDWDMWLGPAPKRGYHSELSPRGVHKHFPNWRNYREYGGGGVTDWGAHHFDIAQWGLGMDESGPNEIIPPPDWQKAQNGVRLLYADGVEVLIAGNAVAQSGSASGKAQGSAATMTNANAAGTNASGSAVAVISLSTKSLAPLRTSCATWTPAVGPEYEKDSTYLPAGAPAPAIALSFKSLGHEDWFYYYLSGIIFLSLLIYSTMRDTKHESAMHRHE